MFDPYHKWLGIPPVEQPPDHYRLLGLARFEADREVIDAAANRQMAYLQGCATGPHVLLSQRLLNEVAAARLTLLSADRKARYDANLMLRSGDEPPAVIVSTVAPVRTRRPEPVPAPRPPLIQLDDVPDEVWHSETKFALNLQSSRSRTHELSRRWLTTILAGSIAVIALGLGVWLRARPAQPPPAVVAPPIPRIVVIPPGPKPEPKSTKNEPTLQSPAKPATPQPTSVQVATTKDGAAAKLPEVEQPWRWRDLLGGVDATRDSAGDQKWSSVQGKLISPDGGSLLSIPGQVPREYKLRVRVLKTSQQMFGVGLFIGDRQHLITLDSYPNDGCFSKFDVADGKGEVFHRGSRLLPLLQESTIVCTVRESSIVVEVGGREVGRWDGDLERLSLHPAWAYGPKDRLFICSVGPGTIVNAIDFQPLTSGQPGSPRSGPDPTIGRAAMAKDVPPPTLPKIPFYPENRFLPLFHGEMIDHTPTNQSNCWLDERFTQFVLRLKFRLRSHADNPWSGVRLRHGSDGARVSLVLYEGACGGLLVDRSPPGLHPGLSERPLEGTNRLILPARRAEGPYGSWNDCEVMCASGETTVAINGVVINHIRDGAGGPGLVCLTGLEGDLAFRAVRLLDLTDRPTTATPESADAPQILHWRTNTWPGSPTDIAEVAENKVRVAMGSQDYGFGEAGCEVASIRTMRVDLNLSGKLRKLDDVSVAAFIIDYRTAGGYTRRQFCPIDAKVTRRNLPHPSWGKGTAPDGVAQLQLRKTYDIDLARWAPPGWDGTVWFSVLLQNTGRDTWMTATLRPVK